MATKGTVVRTTGGVFSLLGGAWVSRYLDLPHGLPESAFLYGIAPLSALAGFEVGQRMRTWNRAIGGVVALAASVLAYFLYYLVLYTASGGGGVVLLVFVLFALVFFSFFFGMGVFSIWILDLQDGKAKPRAKKPKPPNTKR